MFNYILNSLVLEPGNPVEGTEIFLRLYTKYIEMSKLIHEQWDPYRKKEDLILDQSYPWNINNSFNRKI